MVKFIIKRHGIEVASKVAEVEDLPTTFLLNVLRRGERDTYTSMIDAEQYDEANEFLHRQGYVLAFTDVFVMPDNKGIH